MKLTNTTPPVEAERSDVQQIVHRRIALRRGVTLAVAAVMAGHSGLGPEAARRAAR